jgi:hypothetical protein
MLFRFEMTAAGTVDGVLAVQCRAMRCCRIEDDRGRGGRMRSQSERYVPKLFLLKS